MFKLTYTIYKILGKILRNFRFKGKLRLVRLICNPDNAKDEYEYIISYDKDLLIRTKLNSFLEWQIFFNGYYEKEIDDLIKKYLKQGDYALDVGANIGNHTLVMAKQVGRKGKVFAFEPNPEIAERLKYNLDLNKLSNGVIDKRGCSDKIGKSDFYIPIEGAASNYSISPLISTLIRERNIGSSKQIVVDLITLDEFIKENKLQRLDFIKIDTEGYDAKVIKGGIGAIEKFRSIIIFEYTKEDWKLAKENLNEIFDIFSRLNYKLFIIRKKLIEIQREICDNLEYENILVLPNNKSLK